MKITIKQLKKMGIRPIEVAHCCDVSQPAVFKWEHSRTGGIPEKYHKIIIKEIKRRWRLGQKFLKKLSYRLE